jgi:O-antigen chain-terminating methyltransferase
VADHPDLAALRRALAEEEHAYAEALAAVDALATVPAARQDDPAVVALRTRLNELWDRAQPPDDGGVAGAARRQVWQALAPALDRQRDFNSLLVQVLNASFQDASSLSVRLRQQGAALVRYLQRLQPMVDARDRVASGLATTRAELVLEGFDRRLESLGRRLEGLLALRDRVETVSQQVEGVRDALAAEAPRPPVAAAAARAADDAVYAAFEGRFRGSRDELRARLLPYVELFKEQAPVLDLGCGRGDFLELLREAGVAARGVDQNARFAREARGRGLEVVEGDLLAALRACADGALGGVFAAQVAEHLAPAVLLDVLREAHRALRAGGLLVLETVNTRSVLGLLEVFHRDPTHEKPLHPDTLSFVAAAAGFTEVRLEYRSPVDEGTRLQAVPADGLPAAAATVLNENVARLNAVLFAPLEYALVARR